MDKIVQMIIEIDGQRIIYAAPTNGKDYLEMTISEIMAYPALSAEAATIDLFSRIRKATVSPPKTPE